VSTAPGPNGEAERVRLLHALRLSDQAPDPVLDGLVRVAAQALQCPAAAISLVGAERQWFQAAHGLTVRESAREHTFCAQAINSGALFEVHDAQADARFAGLPAVAGAGPMRERAGLPIRFYAGMPIGLDGSALGTLCVFDSTPRTLSDEQRALLLDLSRAVEHWLSRQREQSWLRKISAAVEQASEAIVITDVEATIEYVNDAALRSSGYGRGELIGRNVATLRCGSMPEAQCAEMRARVLAGRPWRGALHSRRKDGSLRLEAATVVPVRDAHNRVSHVLSITHDVTDKHRLRSELQRYRERLDALVARRTEAILQAKAAAVDASNAKSAFLATMSHEIRTPMSGVIGAVELLQRSPLSNYQRELAGTVRDSASALMTLIDGILDFSKIEAGHLDVERLPLDLRDLLEITCDALQPLAMSRGVHLHLFVDPALPALLLGDAVRLRQVVTNLLSNAIKFCAGLDRPGRVAVRAWPVAGGGLRISVGDNGIGLSPQAQSRLFQPFMQVEHRGPRRYGGTGLGLAICQRLTLAMGGRIGVESLPELGARFDVDLPLAARAAPPRPAHDLTGLACHLVIAEDEWADDWGAYLAAAGALVTRWQALPPSTSQALHNSGSVIVVQAELLAGATAPAGPCVELHHGRRRTPRAVAAARIVQDIEGMHGDALLAAVAMAAGRLAPVHTMPGALDEAPLPAPPNIAHAAGEGCLVLVAEDDQTNRLVLERQFALLGVAAEFARDGVDAWQKWRDGRDGYCLLLTDLHMPGMDGFELTAAIRQAEAGAHRMPIVALTASAVAGEIAQCRAAGMDDALGKPIQISALGAALRHWIARGRVEAKRTARSP
jgi:PAS domain S-box-containing protein